MLRSSILIACVTVLASVAVGACGGDTVESDGKGGSGGQVLDSGQDVTTDALPDTGADVGTDGSAVDASVDQSVEPEASVVDAEVIEGSLFDLSMPDVSISDGATLQGCYDCAVSSCTSEMEDCQADDGCRTILLCLFEDQCFGGPNGIDTGCGFGCVQKAGITNPADPAVSIALAAGQCISGSCQNDCGLTADGGLPFDASMPDGF